MPARQATCGTVRFWNKIAVGDPDECWEWLGKRVPSGYGSTQVNNGRYERPHRVAYAFAYGPVPAEKFVCHSCDNPLCCNPHHLFAGTHAENMRDMTRKGRQHRKLSEPEVLKIRDLARSGVKQKEIAKDFGVSPDTVSDIHCGRKWKHLLADEPAEGD